MGASLTDENFFTPVDMINFSIFNTIIFLMEYLYFFPVYCSKFQNNIIFLILPHKYINRDKMEKKVKFLCLNKILPGGIPVGEQVLISGTPGTGKTALAMQFIYEGANSGENGLYVTLDGGGIDSVLDEAASFGMDFRQLTSKKKIDVIRLDPTDIYAFLDDLEKNVKKLNAKRLVIDSLSILTVYAASYRNLPEDIIAFLQETKYKPPITMSDNIKKQMIYTVLREIRRMGCTTIMISELPREARWYSRDTVSEFACGGIILLEYHLLGGAGVSRTLSVVKMRKTKYVEGVHEFKLTSSGFKLV